MQQPTRTALTGLALATTLVGFTACGSSSSSTSSSASTSVSTSPATSATPDASTTPGASTTPDASTSGSPAASGSASTSGVPSGVTLYNAARDTALKATSLHVYGTVLDQGKKLSMDMNGRTDSTNLVETFRQPGQGEFTLLAVGGKYWLKGDRTVVGQFAGAAKAARIGSKWVVVPPAQAKKVMGSSNPETLLKGMFSTRITSAQEASMKVTLTELNGKPAYRMSDTRDDTSMWLSTDPDHHLMRMQGSTFGQLDFTDWNSARAQKAPAASEVFHA